MDVYWWQEFDVIAVISENLSGFQELNSDDDLLILVAMATEL